MSEWHRRTTGKKKESTESYAAFLVYLTMGADRSLAKVGRECGKQTSLIERWSKRDDWVSRAQAYDAMIAQTIIDAQTEAAASSEIHAYRQRAKNQSIALGSIVASGLKLVAKRMAKLTDADLAPDKLASLLRALAACSQAGLDAEAQAIGVTDLLVILEDDDGSRRKDKSSTSDSEEV